MKVLDMNKFTPNNKDGILLFEAYFENALKFQEKKISPETQKFIASFLKQKDFKKPKLKAFLFEVKDMDSRLFHNYKRAFSRDRIKKIRKISEKENCVRVSTMVPKDTHKKFVEFVKASNSTIEEELGKLIQKKVNSL
jgi:hypothetical protein